MREENLESLEDCLKELKKKVETDPQRSLELCGYIEYYARSVFHEICEKHGIRDGR